MDTGTSNQAVNLGIYDGDVAHDEVSARIVEGMPGQWPQRAAVPLDYLWD